MLIKKELQNVVVFNFLLTLFLKHSKKKLNQKNDRFLANKVIKNLVSFLPKNHNLNSYFKFQFSLQGRCLFAIPKKGRLYEKCLELLSGKF